MKRNEKIRENSFRMNSAHLFQKGTSAHCPLPLTPAHSGLGLPSDPTLHSDTYCVHYGALCSQSPTPSQMETSRSYNPFFSHSAKGTKKIAVQMSVRGASELQSEVRYAYTWSFILPTGRASHMVISGPGPIVGTNT